MAENESTQEVVSTPAVETPTVSDTQVAAPAPTEQPAQTTQTEESTSAPVSTPANWDSDENPYKVAAIEHAKQVAIYEERALVQQAEQYHAKLIADGYAPAQAQQITSEAVAQEKAKRQMVQERTQLNEQAKPIVAQSLAQQLRQLHNVDINPNELLYTSNGRPVASPQEMVARADAIVTERKKAAFAARQKTGADSMDKGPASTPAPANINDKLSPEQRLAKWFVSETSK